MTSIEDRLKMAAQRYAIALDAMRDDVECGLGALSSGTLRQLNGNALELHAAFGELSIIREMARKELSFFEIKEILANAAKQYTRSLKADDAIRRSETALTDG